MTLQTTSFDVVRDLSDSADSALSGESVFSITSDLVGRSIILCVPFRKESQSLSQTCIWLKAKVLL